MTSKTAPARALGRLLALARIRPDATLLTSTLALALALPAAPARADMGGHGARQHGMGATGATSAPGTARLGDLIIEDAWTRQTPPRAMAGGGYLTITNASETEQRLVGGSVDFADRVEIHEMSVTDGVMRMAEVEGGIVIPAGETVALEPGGLHVMFLRIAETPAEGDTVPVRLVFAPAGEVTVEMPVAAIGAPSPYGDETGADMDHGTMGHGAMDHGPSDTN